MRHLKRQQLVSNNSNNNNNKTSYVTFNNINCITSLAYFKSIFLIVRNKKIEKNDS